MTRPTSQPETVRSYRDLIVWQRSLDLTERVYAVTERFPRCEVYGLAAQMRRSSVSIPSNIAEGHGRHHLGDYLRHLSVANGSLMELETQVIISARRKYFGADAEHSLLKSSAEIGRMLAGLTRSLNRRRSSSS